MRARHTPAAFVVQSFRGLLNILLNQLNPRGVEATARFESGRTLTPPQSRNGDLPTADGAVKNNVCKERTSET